MEKKLQPQDLPVYELLVDDGDSLTGTKTISLVNMPAVEKNFIAFSFNEAKFMEMAAVSSEEKRMLTGVVAIPDKLIYRNDASGEYYVRMSKSTIERMVVKFFKEKNIHSVNAEHQTPVDGVYVVESWLVGEDPKRDKSSLLFDNLPSGTWMATMKVDSDEIWNQVKSGEFRGFSLEGFFDFERAAFSAKESEEELKIQRIREILKKVI